MVLHFYKIETGSFDTRTIPSGPKGCYEQYCTVYELFPGTAGDKCKSRRSYLRLCNKKRGEENEKDILKLSTYIITSICEKYK